MNMNIFKINTTAYHEEDFHIMTPLTIEEVISVIGPIVLLEREGGEEYDNDLLCSALRTAFPNITVEQYSEFETISI